MQVAVLGHLVEELSHGFDRRLRDEAKRSLVEIAALRQRGVERPRDKSHCLCQLLKVLCIQIAKIGVHLRFAKWGPSHAA